MDDCSVIDLLTEKMFAFDSGDAVRIQHLMKVHRFAQLIGRMEHLDPHLQFVVECAALVHDIGIRPAEETYGACGGKLQEQEGPPYARRMLNEAGLEESDIRRICYLVGHHHTYHQIDGIDYQILIEADFLVNFQEDHLDREHIQKTMNKLFRTSAGISLCKMIYGLEDAKEET